MRCYPITNGADNKGQARDAYREGSRQYDLGEYRAALEAFKRAYLLYEEPAFLFNIAQSHRQLNDKPEAVRFYRTFLRKVPDAPNRAEVERIIATLESAIAEERAAKPPQGTLAPAPRTETRETPVVTPPAAAPVLTTPVQPRPHTRTKRLVGIGLMAAGGALLVVGAVFVGLAKTSNDEIGQPASGIYDPSTQDRRDTFQIVDAVSFAVGGAAAATGLVLYLVDRREDRKLSLSPAPGGVVLRGSF